MKIGFDNQKYLEMQSQHIRDRIAQFDNKLYLEFGGKLFDDYHASRVLPGFQPDSKLQMLLQLKDQAEEDIENNKVRDDYGITYDMDVLRLIDEFQAVGLYVGSVCLTKYAGQASAELFRKKLAELGIKDLSQGKLPDIVAYSAEKDWIYLIEAYHTSNPITAERKYELEQMMGECADKCIYITAFESNDAFRSCKEDLAWETEVWIVTNPDHMIHRNGFRFIGPYGKTTE